MEGYATVTCPKCSKQQKIIVHFKEVPSKLDSHSRFEDKKTNCKYCKTSLLITDKRKKGNKC